jgi:hypothetical protein
VTEDEAYSRLIGYLNSVNALAADLGNTGVLEAIDRAYQAKPRPRGSYATVSLLSERDLEEIECNTYRDAMIGGEARGVRQKFRAHEMLFRIDIYATFATDAGRTLTTALRAEEAALFMAPLVVRKVYPALTTTPMHAQQNWEGRANVDVAIGGVVSASVPTDFIEHGAVDVLSVRPDGLPGFDRRETY